MGFTLKAPKGANKKNIVVGRGKAARRGGTSGRGNNGQNCRSGGGVRLGFEGGQMPLYRRIARRGFSNAMFKEVFSVFNVEDLQKHFKNGDTVNAQILLDMGLVEKAGQGVKILGRGDLTIKLTIQVDKISASAKEKIEKAGGTIL